MKKRDRTAPIDEEAATEDPWVWAEDEIPTSEEMRIRKRNELSESFAKSMVQRDSPWKFWFPEHEKEDWVLLFENKGFIVKDLDVHAIDTQRRLYLVQIDTSKRQKINIEKGEGNEEEGGN